MQKLAVLSALLLLACPLTGQELVRYQTPAKELLELLDAPATPAFSISPNKGHYLLAYPTDMPDLAELAQPQLKLAGIRINPNNYGASEPRTYSRFEIAPLGPGKSTPITGLPTQGVATSFRWSPNGNHLAFSIYLPNRIELWVASVSSGVARRVATNLNETLVHPAFQWMSNSETLLYAAVVEGLRKPEEHELPLGPSVQQTSGKRASARTFQDLLKKASDEMLFEFYCTSRLTVVNLQGEATELGNRAIHSSFEPSPDGNYILVAELVRPFSYLVPARLFPTHFHILGANGHPIKRLAELPLADDIAQGFSAARKGPRSFFWRSDKPATIFWVEAQDEGNPKKESRARDALFCLDAPFRENPTKIVELDTRFAGIDWGWSNFAIVHGQWWSNRRTVSLAIDPSKPNENPKTLWDRSYEDAYGNPGRFVPAVNSFGRRVLLTDKSKQKLYLSGTGASPEGDRPFLDEYSVRKGTTTRLWQSQSPTYEYFVDFVDAASTTFVTSRETATEQPNYYLRNLKKEAPEQLTSFQHPYPTLRDVHKEVVHYKRSDGVQLTGTLYLPTGYNKGDKALPTLMWAYPQEFTNASHAGQVKGSPHRFIRPSRLGAVLWVARGYAVFDNISMPIVAKNGEEANNTFVEQLVDNAQSAIDTLVSMGVTDPKRVAIGGHSYGAFMTVNLMAHSDLFATGIARSGAYNRTLTPFGFQNEERTYWQAPEVYNAMSPFMHADKINEPLLLIHGENDNNSGTFPLQSERLYSAIKGHGGSARLVLLPFESHGYKARQSILHTVWEMDNWLSAYLK